MDSTTMANLNQLIALYKLSPTLRTIIITKINERPTAEKIYFMKGCTSYIYNRKINTLKTKSGCGCGR